LKVGRTTIIIKDNIKAGLEKKMFLGDNHIHLTVFLDHSGEERENVRNR
jgi:hypothetical protein